MERKRFFLLIGLLAAICICLLIYCNQRADTVPATKTKSGEDIIMTSGRGQRTVRQGVREKWR